jgi:tetratricopeptide (TPR) repeat protein
MGLFDWFKRRRSGDASPPSPASSRAAEDSEAKAAERVEQALERIQQKDLEGARRLLLGIIALAPRDYVNQFEADGKLHIKFWSLPDFLGYVAWMQAGGQPRDVVWLKNAYPRAYYYLGYLHIELGQFDTAVQVLDQGLRLDPGNPKLSNEKAQALVRLKRFPEALEVYEQVLARDGYVNPTDKAFSFRGKGFVLIELGDLDGAERAFRESLEYEPDSQMAAQELEYIQQLRARSGGAGGMDISEEEFQMWYQGYQLSLSMDGKQSNWNDDIDDLARSIGALTEAEIAKARTDFHQAILNRIKMRIAMERRHGS